MIAFPPASTAEGKPCGREHGTAAGQLFVNKRRRGRAVAKKGFKWGQLSKDLVQAIAELVRIRLQMLGPDAVKSIVQPPA